jgi:hypothetical protein
MKLTIQEIQYIRELEEQANTTHEDLTSLTEQQIEDYVEALYLACLL